MRQALLGFLVLGTITAGCARPRLDTTSDDTVARSLARMSESLPAGQREKFASDVMLLALEKTPGGLLGLAAQARGGQPSASIFRPLNGKTAQEIMREADRIRAAHEVEARAQRAKEREQVAGELQELEAKKAAASKAREDLSRFEVMRSRYYKTSSGFLQQPMIELTVKNGTGASVSRAYFVGTVATPGRAVPWIKEDFNYEIPGGLEPGETKNWRLQPNMFSAWRIDVPKDAVFTVTVERLDGADRKPLYDARWGDEEEQRAEALRKQLASR